MRKLLGSGRRQKAQCKFYKRGHCNLLHFMLFLYDFERSSPSIRSMNGNIGNYSPNSVNEILFLTFTQKYKRWNVKGRNEKELQ